MLCHGPSRVGRGRALLGLTPPQPLLALGTPGFLQEAPVDESEASDWIACIVNLRYLKTKLSRLNLTKADREIAELKAQFRKEDLALVKEGRSGEIALRNRRLMGLADGARTRLVGFGGVRFE